MKARQPPAHCVQVFFAKDFFNSRKHFVFLESYMVVKQLREVSHGLCAHWGLSSQMPLKILSGGADFDVIGEEPHDIGVLMEPLVSRVGGQEHFLLLAEMNPPCLVPESDKFLCLARHSRRAFVLGRFRRAPHLQCLNQREMVMLAERMEARMAFHNS